MTVETCKLYYEQAKEKGNQEQMEFWKKRCELKGGSVEEEKVEEVSETKSKGKK